jgi:non-ribosomal peptide synthetase component F
MFNPMAANIEETEAPSFADRNQRVSPELDERQRHQILIDWNSTGSDFPKDRSIRELIAEQALQTPAAPAVVMDDQCLTYAELDGLANQVAHYLRNIGVGPEVLVGVCIERSLEMIVGLLGILKAGGAYLPLDQKYPQKHLAYLLKDAGISAGY